MLATQHRLHVEMKAAIHVLGENGYVWDADVAHWLRLECGLVGAMVGGVTAFKQQNAVHGLPLELSPEEVTLVLERGWGELQPLLGTAQLAAQAAEAAAAAAGRKRGREANPYHYYESEEDDEGDFDMQDAQQQQAEQQEEPEWRQALAQGSTFVVPTTPAEAAAANGTGSGTGAAGRGDATNGDAAAAAAAAAAAGEPPQWNFPASEEERHRYWIFRDLHAKGYRLTGGSKFGADYLVYPGDPTIYHAQFCVRLMPYDAPILPVMLSSATRGSHQARKHLLLASVVEEGQEEGAAGAGAGAPAAQAALDSSEQQQEEQPDVEEGAYSAAQLQGEGTGAGSVHIGANSRGTGSRGERFRIRYMTLGPVEGFG